MRYSRSSSKVGARGLVREEHGFAVPTVLFMLLGAFAVVSIGVLASISAQRGSVRDQDTKSALSAAEAGVSDALLRYNAVSQPPPVTQPCLVPSGTTLGATATQSSGSNAGWCAAASGSSGSGTYSYTVKPAASADGLQVGTIEIASTGSFNGISRRVDVVAKSASGQQVFLDAAVKTQDAINLDSNAIIHAGAATGGDITLASNAMQCSPASVGKGHHLTIAPGASGGYFDDPQCTTSLDPSTVGQDDLVLPPVNQGDAATNNDNCRVSRAVGVPDPNCTFNSSDPQDLISGKNSDVNWSPTTRQLEIDKPKTTLTLTGHTYSFCKVTLKQNTALYVAANTNINIYFDSPEACDQPPGTLPADNATYGTTQLSLASNTRISANTGTPGAIAMYFVGSPVRPTQALMSSNTQANQACVQNFILYAPLTHLELNSNSVYCGAVAGKSLHMDSNAQFFTDLLSRQYIIPGTPPHFITSKFVDCDAASGSPPNSGC
jgi:Tfp pilus assembly protein PilX